MKKRMPDSDSTSICADTHTRSFTCTTHGREGGKALVRIKHTCILGGDTITYLENNASIMTSKSLKYIQLTHKFRKERETEAELKKTKTCTQKYKQVSLKNIKKQYNIDIS